MYEKGLLTIGNWTKGMADSAYQGFSNISCCEIFDTPGVVKIANRTLSKISISLTGTPIAYVEDSFGNYYFLTSDGKLYKNQTLITSGLTNPWDLIIYNDYLLIRYDTILAAYGPISSGGASFLGTVVNGTGFNGSYYGKMTGFKNSTVYITNGTSIAWISALSTAAVGVAPTATVDLALIELPDGEAATTIAPIGTYMIIGTQASNGSWFNGVNGNVANLYLFDGVGTDNSPNSLVGSLNEACIQSMLSIGNALYVMAGIRGNLYKTNTASFIKIKRIPYNQRNAFGNTTRVYPNAMSVNVSGNLLIGTSTLEDAFTGNDTRHGVWEVSLSEGYPTVFKQQVSTGNVGQTNPLTVGVIFSGKQTTIIGYKDGSSYGLDTTDQTPYPTGATIETKLVLIASRVERKTFKQLEYLLGKLLVTGQSITLSYRKNLTDSYTAWKSFTFSDLGAVISHNTNAALDEIEILQIKIELAQTASATKNIELMRLIAW